jgi:hypothetical protein
MIMIGRKYPRVHKALDALQGLLQSGHREFMHDYAAVLQIYKQTGDLKQAWSAYYHVILDNLSDSFGKDECIARLLLYVEKGQIPRFSERNFPPKNRFIKG